MNASVIENINELINIFGELIDQNIIIYPRSLLEIYNYIKQRYHNSDDNFIQIDYNELLNRGYFLAKNHICVQIITDTSIGNFTLVKMDNISLNILWTYKQIMLNDEENFTTADDRAMNYEMQSRIKKRPAVNGYSKYYNKRKKK